MTVGWWGEEKNEGTLDGVEEKGVRRGGKRWGWKNSRMKQIVLPYIYV